jgi:hypothetical protein
VQNRWRISDWIPQSSDRKTKHGADSCDAGMFSVVTTNVHSSLQFNSSFLHVSLGQNIFYNKKISKTFDLKGSLRGRFAAHIQNAKNDDSHPETPMHGSEASTSHRKRGSDHGTDAEGESEGDESNPGANKGKGKASSTLLDGDFLEFTAGRPMPMNDRAKAVFHMSILNVSTKWQ